MPKKSKAVYAYKSNFKLQNTNAITYHVQPNNTLRKMIEELGANPNWEIVRVRIQEVK